jgi:lysozyme family protein
MNFDTAFAKLLEHEGGFSDHAADPGGETRYGITEAVAREAGYTGDMQELPIDIAKSIYKAQYWDAVRADELPESIRYPVFDAAVNSGHRQAAKWLQRAVSVDADGIIGKQTLMASKVASAAAVRAHMLGQRLQFMTGLNTWAAFGKGWSRRIAAILMERD